MIIVDTMPKENFEKQKIPGAANATLPPKMEYVRPEQKENFLKALGRYKNKKL
ncbi:MULTISPECIES: rhodanese-like domain-containing protein [unclassified Gemella]|uniref:rhodanese-like domain-containing protein n=1 Tax=unclassified Gemella TaxID=2624949 RepID=UPI00207B7145|nr:MULTISPECIES: rhodanese-like domain-containing protein [unclassified Gemella]